MGGTESRHADASSNIPGVVPWNCQEVMDDIEGKSITQYKGTENAILVGMVAYVPFASQFSHILDHFTVYVALTYSWYEDYAELMRR